MKCSCDDARSRRALSRHLAANSVAERVEVVVMSHAWSHGALPAWYSAEQRQVGARRTAGGTAPYFLRGELGINDGSSANLRIFSRVVPTARPSLPATRIARFAASIGESARTSALHVPAHPQEPDPVLRTPSLRR